MPRRTEILQATVTPDEKRVVCEIARHDGHSYAEVIRELILREGRQRGLWPTRRAVDERMVRRER